MTTQIISLLALLGGLNSAHAAKCTYELDKSSVTAGWTAYKTTEKLPVNGSFKTVNVEGKTKGKKLAKLVEGISVVIDRTSVATGNPARDQTLVTAFFNKLAPKQISGKISQFSEAGKTLNLNLEFNGKNKAVPMTFTMEGDNLKATGNIDILDFAGQDALASLNTACLDLHKGKDGVSKTWSDVAINLGGKITSTCK